MQNLSSAILRLKSTERCQLKQIVETKQILSDLPSDISILDFSCGDGIWSLVSSTMFGQKISKIIATDLVDCPISSDTLKLIKSQCNFQFIKVEGDKRLPFPDNSFDLVIHHDVLEHTRKPYGMLQEHQRVLKEGGTLFFSTPNLLRLTNIIKLLCGQLSFPTKIGENEEIGDYIHEQEFSLAGIEIMLEELNFESIDVYSKLFGLMPLQLFYDFNKKKSLIKNLGQLIFAVSKKGNKNNFKGK